jgi:glycosyltransferase involved in cell wall biosynthesis
MHVDPVADAPLVLHVYATFAVGGPQVRFAAIANRFGPRWRHAVVAMDGNTACRERLDRSLDVTFPQVGIRKGDMAGNVLRFRRVLLALRPQTLLTSNWGSIEWVMANALVRVRHAHVEDGFGPEERSAQLVHRVLVRRAFLRFVTVAVPSRTLWRIAAETWRLNPRRLCYVPNGIDWQRFVDVAAVSWPGEGPVVGTVAALREEKNLSRLLRAFRLATAEMPARLVIVGDGPERARLEALARELGIAERVHFAGHVAQPQRFYCSFDLFALSSDTEQMPLSVLEAMAAGLPVAATDVGDVRVMLAEANGAFVTQPEDAALAEELRRLLRQPGLRQVLGAANRAKAARDYDEETMFRTWAALIDGTAAHTRSGRLGPVEGTRRPLPEEEASMRFAPWGAGGLLASPREANYQARRD